MDLINSYRGSSDSEAESNEEDKQQVICKEEVPSTAADNPSSIANSLETKEEYRAASPCTSDDEFGGNCKVQSDDDSEAEFNQILELCRKQRDGAQQRSSRPSVNLDKVFNSEYYYNLPPMESLQIHVDEDITLTELGRVDCFIDFMVNVKPHKGMPILDFDTMLFDEERNAIGEIFEIFGSVQDVMYALRFSNAGEAKKCVSLGMPVFYAPQEGLITKTVLTQELMKMKLSDSAQDGDDSNDDERAFSDDEAEAAYLAKKRAKARPAPHSNFAGFNRPPYGKRPRQTPRQFTPQTGPMNFFNSPYM